MADVHNDPAIFQEFREALGTRDPKTIATYLTTTRDFVAWLVMQPGDLSKTGASCTSLSSYTYITFLAGQRVST